MKKAVKSKKAPGNLGVDKTRKSENKETLRTLVQMAIDSNIVDELRQIGLTLTAMHLEFRSLVSCIREQSKLVAPLIAAYAEEIAKLKKQREEDEKRDAMLASLNKELADSEAKDKNTPGVSIICFRCLNVVPSPANGYPEGCKKISPNSFKEHIINARCDLYEPDDKPADPCHSCGACEEAPIDLSLGENKEPA